jgi:adenylate kinase family enzyme
MGNHERLIVSEIGLPLAVGSRVVVTGMAGAGKSTFSRALSAKTGLPVIHLDLHSWNPGWVRTPEDEFREKQRVLLAGKEWIIDGNDAVDLVFERADTLVLLDTPWWICARRAFVRGLRRPRGLQLPEGCDDSTWRRLHDEWWLVWRIWRGRHAERERELAIASKYRGQKTVHILRSTQAARELIDRATSNWALKASEG